MATRLMIPPASPFLTVFKDGALVDSFCLDGYKCIVLGRHTSCDVLASHPSVSRHHCEIRLLHDTHEVLLTDLDSVHGTWINGKQAPALVSVTAKEGDSINLGASSRTYKVQWLFPPQTTRGGENSEHSDMRSESTNFERQSNACDATQSLVSTTSGGICETGDSSCFLRSIEQTENPVATSSPSTSQAADRSIIESEHQNGSRIPFSEICLSVVPPTSHPKRSTAAIEEPFLNEDTVGISPAASCSNENTSPSMEINKQQTLSRTPIAEIHLTKFSSPTVQKESSPKTAVHGSQHSPSHRKNETVPRPNSVENPLHIEEPVADTVEDIANEEQEIACPKGSTQTGNGANPDSSRLWLRRCKAQPPPRLFTSAITASAVPPGIVLPASSFEQESAIAFPSAPPLPSYIIPSAPPMPPQTNSSPFLPSARAPSTLKEIACVTESESKADSLGRAGSEEEYASDKENQGNVPFPQNGKNLSKGHDATEATRRPFQSIYVTSSDRCKPSSPALSEMSLVADSFKQGKLPPRGPSPVLDNLDFMLESFKGMARSEPRRVWHIVVDVTCFQDDTSFRSLKMLEGIREVRLIVPKIVISELDSVKFRGKVGSKALKWIESCMVKLPSWIHVQSSSESLSVGVTPPASPHHHDLFLSSMYGGRPLKDLLSPTNGDHVLNCALVFHSCVPDGQVALVTCDTALKIKAMAEGLVCESPAMFCDSLLSPYSDRFLWAGSIAHGPKFSERTYQTKTNSALAPVGTCKPRAPHGYSTRPKHHVSDALKHHCKQAQGLRGALI